MRNIIYILFFISLVKPQFSLYDNFKSLFNKAKITNEEIEEYHNKYGDEIIFQMMLVQDNFTKIVKLIESIDEVNDSNFSKIINTDSKYFFINNKNIEIFKAILSNEQTKLLLKNKKLKIGLTNKTFLAKGDIIEFMFLIDNPILDNTDIINALATGGDRHTHNAGKGIINIGLSKKGSQKFSRFTAKNIGKRAAILINNEVILAPYINEKISGGNIQISGIDDSLEAIYIAHILNGGEW